MSVLSLKCHAPGLRQVFLFFAEHDSQRFKTQRDAPFYQSWPRISMGPQPYIDLVVLLAVTSRT